MKKQLGFKLLSLFLVVGLLLSACSSGGDKKETTGKSTEKVDTSKFPMTVKNDEEIVKDGSLNYALVSDTPFEGTFSGEFYSGNPDFEVFQFFEEPLFKTNKDYEITNDGAATYELSKDKKTITVKIKDNVNWSDGKPVTAEDYEYSYLVIGNKDYTGVRYGDALIQDIVGMAEYHKGKADKISGIKIIDKKTLSITWNKPNPSVLTGIWAYAMPKHYLKDIAIKDLPKSDKIRKKAIGFGPFKIKKIVPGESVEFERNDDYYGGKPNLKSLIVKVVSPKVILAALEKGEVDIAKYPTDQYEAAKNAKNINFVGNIEGAYTYIGFKLGHWDAKKSEAVMDNPKFKDKKLRQAMAYALDNQKVGDQLYKGLRFPATTLIPPFFPGWHDENAKGYAYDPEKAKKLLDEAGYKDKNGDGLREDPNGKEFKINFASMSGGDIAEPLAKFYIQQWKDVGLDVQLVDGRLVEFNSFYEMIQNDDKKVDIYQAAWGTGTDVDPYGLYSKTAVYNYTRFVDDKNEQLLSDGHSEKAFDAKYRKKVYDEWQAYMHEEVPVIPTLYRYELYALNNRVKNFSLDSASDLQNNWQALAVTADKPETK
ncbi:oligopeptide ABC transporter substrate-binding protein [Heyndrickxia sporothermodurans]